MRRRRNIIKIVLVCSLTSIAYVYALDGDSESHRDLTTIEQQGYCLDVFEGATHSNANIVQRECEDATDQGVMLNHIENNVYSLKKSSNGLCMQPTSGSATSAATVVQSHCTDDELQQYAFYPANGNNSVDRYRLRNVENGRCLTAEQGSLIQDASVVHEACDSNNSGQVFQIPHIPSFSGDGYCGDPGRTFRVAVGKSVKLGLYGFAHIGDLPSGLMSEVVANGIRVTGNAESAGDHCVVATDLMTGESIDTRWVVRARLNFDPVLTLPMSGSELRNDMDDHVHLKAQGKEHDGDQLTFSATGLPHGLVIDSATGIVSGTPSEAGEYTVKISVDDGQGGNDKSTFRWLVGTNEAVQPIPQIRVLSASSLEHEGKISVPVVLTHATADTVTVDLSAASGTATVGEDFERLQQTITFRPGERRRDVMIATMNDGSHEALEQFRVRLSNPRNASLGVSQARVSIQDGALPANSAALPQISVLDAEVIENAGFVNIKIVMTTISELPVTVAFSTSKNTAMPGEDFFGTFEVVEFAPRETEVIVPLTVLNDDFPEGDETFNLHLGAPTDATIDPRLGVVTIIDEDDPDSPLPPNADPTFIKPTDGQEVFSNVGDAVSFDVITADPNGDPPAFSAQGLPEGLTIDSETGLITGTVSVLGASNVSLTVVDGRGGRDDVSFVWTVVEARSRPTLNIQPIGAIEIDGSVDISITLSEPAPEPVTVIFSTADSSATAGEDYTEITETVEFAPGTTQQIVSVTLLDDNAIEGDEEFLANLSNPVNADLGDSSVSILILDDDEIIVPDISVEPVFTTEEDTEVSLILRLSLPTNVAVSVAVATEDDTAKAFEDYLPVSETITFDAGETEKTIAISLVDDSTPEAVEAFKIVLSDPVNANLANDETIVTIDDQDTDVLPTLNVGSLTVNESDGVARVPVTLSTPNAETVTVEFVTQDATALSDVDYTSTFQTVSYAPGETVVVVEVTITDDGVGERGESFFVVIQTPTNAQLGQAFGSVTIDDDDEGQSPTPPNADPTIINPTSNSVFENTVGDTVSFQVVSADPDGDSPSFSADGLPAGLSLDPSSGEISGTPNQPGEFMVTITATEGRGGSDAVTFMWKISGAP